MHSDENSNICRKQVRLAKVKLVSAFYLQDRAA
eukprot:COSAG05_NODE_12903_length_450_cov_0.458689_1_plen_32_part_01